jgi:hypothetical protein
MPQEHAASRLALQNSLVTRMLFVKPALRG